MNRWRIAGGIVVLVLLAMLCWLLGREHREPPPPPPVPPEASPTAPPPAPPAPPPPVPAPPTVAEAPPLPRTETPEPPAAPAPGPSLAAIVVRDIADGNPVAGLAFQLTLAPASGSAADPEVSAEASTDALGRLEVDEKRLRSFRPKSDPWHLLGSRDSLEETIRNGAWVYRTMTILATVEVEGEDETFQLGSIKADQATVPDDLARDETAPPAPLRKRSVEWLRRRSIESAFVLQPETARMLRVTCPWTGGGSIAFSHPGWLSVLAPLQGMDPAGENRVTLRFLRAPRVRGIVRDRDGKPLSGVGVRVYTTRRGNYEEGDAMAAMARHPGGGLSISRNKRLNQSRVTLLGQYMTKQDGAFELPIHQDGESLLLIWEKEFEPFHRTLGPLHGDLDVGEVVLGGPAAIAQVQALWDGKPQKAGEFLLSDFRFPDAQPAISVTLDEEGRFPASLLVQGGEYAVIPQGKDVSDPRARWLEWKGEGVVDLGKLRFVTDVLTERAR